MSSEPPKERSVWMWVVAAILGLTALIMCSCVVLFVAIQHQQQQALEQVFADIESGMAESAYDGTPARPMATFEAAEDATIESVFATVGAGLEDASSEVTPGSTVEVPTAPAGDAPLPGDATVVATPAPDAPTGVVLSGGALQAAPEGEPVIGQLCPGDQVEFLLQEGTWFKVRVYATAADCVPERVVAGTEGWATADLLSEPSVEVPGLTPQSVE